MKHIDVRQKYSAARRFFNSLLDVSSGDELLLDTASHALFSLFHGDELLRLMLDILLHVLHKTSQEVSRRSRTVDVEEMK